MKFEQSLWLLLFKLSLGFAATGTLINKSHLANFGIVSGFLTGGKVIVSEQQKQQKQIQEKLTITERSLQQELVEAKQINSSLNRLLDKAIAKTNKHQKQLQTQLTRQRLNLSAVEKLRHQHKSVVNRVANCEQKLSKRDISKVPVSLSAANNANQDRFKALPKQRDITTHIYIDGNNLKYALDELNIELDYVALRICLTPETGKTSFKFYTGVHSIPSQGQDRFLNYLRNCGYEVTTLNISRRENDRWKTVGDDIQIAIDLLQEVKQGDCVILVSGDGDFIPIVEAMQHRNVEVTVVAKSDMLSRDLERISDRVIYLDDIKYQIAKHTKIEVA